MVLCEFSTLNLTRNNRPDVHLCVCVCVGDHPLTAEAIARKIGLITTKTRKDVARERGVPLESVSEVINIIIILALIPLILSLIYYNIDISTGK